MVCLEGMLHWTFGDAREAMHCVANISRISFLTEHRSTVCFPFHDLRGALHLEAVVLE